MARRTFNIKPILSIVSPQLIIFCPLNEIEDLASFLVGDVVSISFGIPAGRAQLRRALFEQHSWLKGIDFPNDELGSQERADRWVTKLMRDRRLKSKYTITGPVSFEK
jgi:hypothetical protein